MYRLSVILFVIFLCASSIKAQNANFNWVRTSSGTKDAHGNSVALDLQRNVYTTGYFSGTVDFDPGPGVFNLSAVVSWDIFILKLDSSGNFIWAKAIGGSNFDEGENIMVDTSGHVFVAGYFNQSVDFDPGLGVFSLSSVGVRDIFILKLDSAGNFLWAKTMGGSGNDAASSLTLDPLGNVYTTGSFVGVVDFDPNFPVYNLTTSGYDEDAFVLKLDSSGNFIWAKSFGGVDIEKGLSIKSDLVGNVYTSGRFSDTTDFDPGIGIFTAIPFTIGNGDIFISKLDTYGNFKWVRTFGGMFEDVGATIALDALGNIYATGGFIGTIDFDPGPAVFNLSSSKNPSDVFVSKFDTAGNFLWATSMTFPHSSRAMSIAIDTSNNVYTIGNFTALPIVANSPNAFIHKIHKSGTVLWKKEFNSTHSSQGFSIALDISGNIYSVGSFSGTTDFDPGSGIHNETCPTTKIALFIHKMSPCIKVLASLVNSNSVSCYGRSDGSATIAATGGTNFTYSWTPKGGNGVTATGLTAGTYTCLITNDCGDTVTQKVVITQPAPIDTSTNLSNGHTITANQGGATYQWVNCNSFQPIPGATNQTYTATSSGNYAVIIKKGVCSDTSACINIIATGIEQVANGDDILFYPNPNDGQFTINAKVDAQITITDAVGRIILKRQVNVGKNNVCLETQLSGIYFLKITNKNGQYFKQILVKK